MNKEQILDLGCGYGWYTNYLSSINGEVTGCDGSKKMISIAKSLYPNYNFEIVDIEAELPYRDNSFDIVFCNQVLMDIKKLDNLLKNAYRIIKLNGLFYFSIVHPAFYDCNWEQDKNGFRKNKIMSKYLSEYSF